MIDPSAQPPRHFVLNVVRLDASLLSAAAARSHRLRELEPRSNAATGSAPATTGECAASARTRAWTAASRTRRKTRTGSAGPAPSGSSTSEVIVTGSVETDVFFTSTVNCTGPPGSGTEVGLAVFVTLIDGATSVIVTVASSSSLTGSPSSSWPLTVTTL